MSHISKSDFEKFRESLIDKLLALKYEDDPHVIFIAGNHDDFETESMACNSFMGQAALHMLERIAERQEMGL